MITKTCKECQERPVFIKKRELCVICYGRWSRNRPGRKDRYKGYRTDYYSKRRKLRIIDNLIAKHGLEIITDIARLHYRPYWGLTDLGNKYGFTRERARQLFASIYRKPYREIASEKLKKVKAQEITCKNDPLHKIAEYKDGKTRDGAKIELLFMERCKSIGLTIKILCETTVDFNVNGHLVEVKSSMPRYVSTTSRHRHFVYVTRMKQRIQSDFFACYHSLLDIFFIIPSEEVNISGPKDTSICIMEHPIFEEGKGTKNRYWEYVNAWHLLFEEASPIFIGEGI